MEQPVDSSAIPQTVQATAENRGREKERENEREGLPCAGCISNLGNCPDSKKAAFSLWTEDESDHPSSAPEHQPEGEQESLNPEEAVQEDPNPLVEAAQEDLNPPVEAAQEDPNLEEAQEKTAESRLEGLLAAVQQDRSNFEAWEALLKGAEVAEDITLIRKVRSKSMSFEDSKPV